MTIVDQVREWHCRGRPETGRGKDQVLGRVGGRDNQAWGCQKQPLGFEPGSAVFMGRSVNG